MTEWGVVGVIVVLIGLVTAIMTPTIKLAKAATKLTVVVEELQKTVSMNRDDNRASHDKLWQKNREQDDSINDCKTRISVLESRKAERE